MRSPPLRSDSRHCRRGESVKNKSRKHRAKRGLQPAIAALAMIDLSRVQSVQQHYASLHPRVMPIRVIATDPQFVNQSRYAGSVAAYSWVSEVVSSPQAGRSCGINIPTASSPPATFDRRGLLGISAVSDWLLQLAKHNSNVR